ncbi:MAG: hypothetical protein PF495_14030, partial [Spirochaetales bacterium]|nr:hypothetical protein [Spirochaetales bacterium]
MKKIFCLLIVTLLFTTQAYAGTKWKMFFKAEREVIGQVEGMDVMGYKLGPSDEIEYLTGAHWYSGGEWHFGNVKDWKAAGSPDAVWFGQLREIMGVN